jgi:hypothetical protein
MDQKEVELMAAEFVLGTLNRGMLLQFKDELTHNPALREAVKDWERQLGMERTSLTRPRKTTIPLQDEIESNGTAQDCPDSGARDEFLCVAERGRLQAIALATAAAQKNRRNVETLVPPARPEPELSVIEATVPGTPAGSEIPSSEAAQPATKVPEAPGAEAAGASASRSPLAFLPGSMTVTPPPEIDPARRNHAASDGAAAHFSDLTEVRPEAEATPPAPKAVDPEAPLGEESVILRANEGAWEALAPRVYKKQLNRDDSFNRQSYLLRMIPGGRIQPQRRGGIEEVYVLEGRVGIGEASLGPGDFHAFPAKSFIPEITASGDSLILVRGHIAARIPDPEGTA